MSIIQQMGIQRWRRRAVVAASPSEPLLADPGQNAPAVQVIEKSTERQRPSQHDRDARDDKSGVSLRSADQTVSETVNTDYSTMPLAESNSALRIEDCSWQELKDLHAGGTICESCKQQESIFGSGDPNADWVIVIDAPSARDVQNGQLLSGREGLLFDAILQSVGVGRKDIYLCPVRKCATSDNSLSPAGCGKLLHRQLSLINPKAVLAMGEVAAQSVLRANGDMHNLGQEDLRLQADGAAVVTTCSLHDILDHPVLKAQLWQDLKKCRMVL